METNTCTYIEGADSVHRSDSRLVAGNESECTDSILKRTFLEQLVAVFEGVYHQITHYKSGYKDAGYRVKPPDEILCAEDCHYGGGVAKHVIALVFYEVQDRGAVTPLIVYM